MSRKLTPKQQRFVEEYLVDLNGTQAAIRAGYSPKTANEQAARLLADVSIQGVVDEQIEKRSRVTGIDSAKVLVELSHQAFYDPLVFADIKKPADLEKLPVHLRKAVTGWGWDKLGNFALKLADKKGSQELIGRHLKMFTDKVELGGEVGTRGEMSDMELANRMLTLIGTLERRAKGDGNGGA